MLSLVMKMYFYSICIFCVLNYNTLFYKLGQILSSLTRETYIRKIESFQDGGISNSLVPTMDFNVHVFSYYSVKKKIYYAHYV